MESEGAANFNMKASEWKRAAQPLAGVLTDFRAMRRGFVREHEWVAECIYANQSGFSRGIYLEAFVMPLFIPTDTIYFNHGFRIGGGAHLWSVIDGQTVAFVRDALPQLHHLASLPTLAAGASELAINVRHLELSLCASLILQDERKFARMCHPLQEWRVELSWEKEVVDRCQALVELVNREGMESGISFLRGRRQAVLAILQ